MDPLGTFADSDPAAAAFFRDARRRLDALYQSSSEPQGLSDGLEIGPAGLSIPERVPETQWVKITAVDLGHPFPRHAWVEVGHDPQGAVPPPLGIETIDGGGVGTLTQDWAEEANGAFADAGEVVLLRRDKFGRWLFAQSTGEASGSGAFGGTTALDIPEPYDFECEDGRIVHMRRTHRLRFNNGRLVGYEVL